MKYLVSYTVDKYLQGEEGVIYAPENGTFVVEARDKTTAFISAYEQLVHKGYMVTTVSPDEGTLVWGEGRKIGPAIAGLTDEEIQTVYDAGVPRVKRTGINVALIEEIRLYEFRSTNSSTSSQFQEYETTRLFVDPIRLEELKQIRSEHFDLTRLIRICEELNKGYANGCLLSVAVLTRALLDHVAPVFGFETFAKVANDYNGTKSFRESIQHLQNSSRKIADAHLHTPIRKKETLPTPTQVNFSNDLDVLLSEILRILK